MSSSVASGTALAAPPRAAPTAKPFQPAIHWMFAADIDATYEELKSRGCKIVDPPENKPWGLRQFTVEDSDGNRFYFHCD